MLHPVAGPAPGLGDRRLDELADLLAMNKPEAAYALLREIYPGLERLELRRRKVGHYGTPAQELNSLPNKSATKFERLS